MGMSYIIRSNYETHGLEWTVRWAKAKRLNPDTVIFAITGRYR